MNQFSTILEGNKRDLLIYGLGVQSILVAFFVICSLIVSSTPNNGLNCVLTGFMNVGLVVGAYHVMKRNYTPVAYGFLLGCMTMMALINLQTTIFWSNLSYCEQVNSFIPHYACSHTTTYSVISFLAFLLFLIQLGHIAVLVVYKNELMQANYEYMEIPQAQTPFSFRPSQPGQFHPTSRAATDI